MAISDNVYKRSVEVGRGLPRLGGFGRGLSMLSMSVYLSRVRSRTGEVGQGLSIMLSIGSLEVAQGQKRLLNVAGLLKVAERMSFKITIDLSTPMAQQLGSGTCVIRRLRSS